MIWHEETTFPSAADTCCVSSASILSSSSIGNRDHGAALAELATRFGHVPTAFQWVQSDADADSAPARPPGWFGELQTVPWRGLLAACDAGVLSYLVLPSCLVPCLISLATKGFDQKRGTVGPGSHTTHTHSQQGPCLFHLHSPSWLCWWRCRAVVAKHRLAAHHVSCLVRLGKTLQHLDRLGQLGELEQDSNTAWEQESNTEA